MKGIDNIIKESVNRFLVREYLDKDYMMPLVKYMQMDKKSIIWNNIHKNLEMVCDYLKINDYYEKKIKPQITTDDKEYNKEQARKFTDELIKEYPKQINNYIKDISNVYGEDHSTNLMMEKPRLFKNNWVIHMTDKPYTVLKNGFYGISNKRIDKLWRTFNYHYEHEKGVGYGFAFDINDLKKESYDDLGEKANGYGEYGLIFRTSGLKMFNKIDGDDQIIFNVEQVNMKDCILLHVKKTVNGNNGLSQYDDNYDVAYDRAYEIIDPISQKIYFQSNDIYTAIMWGIDNYRQYKKLNIFGKKNKDFINSQRYNALEKVHEVEKYLQNCSPMFIKFADDMTDMNTNEKYEKEYKDYYVLWREYTKDGKNYITYFDRDSFIQKFNLKRIESKIHRLAYANDDLEVCLQAFPSYYSLDYTPTQMFKSKYGDKFNRETQDFAAISIKSKARN